MTALARVPPQSDVELLLPFEDVSAPQLSIVIPTLDERITIVEFLDWCKEGLQRAGVVGEILIVDSSSDETPELALANGARVLRTPKRGLGRAYIDALPYIRGEFVLMGDADCTYDFREIRGFVQAFRAGYEYVMGSRFRGYIEPGSMPALHRYFGTPLTTRILNVLYSTKFSDIHCGMRGITRDALERLELESQSWQYASEMVLKSVCLGLRTTEVPVRFLKDKEGRLSHMKRNGWTEPWRAGWINLRSMLTHGADFFLLRPGLVLLCLGALLMIAGTLGIRLGAITFSSYWSLLGLTFAVVGLQSFYLGCIVQVSYGYSGATSERWLRMFEFNRAMLVSAILFASGLLLTFPLVVTYVRLGFRLPSTGTTNRLSVTGMFLLISSFLTFSSTLVVHASALRTRPRKE